MVNSNSKAHCLDIQSAPPNAKRQGCWWIVDTSLYCPSTSGTSTPWRDGSGSCGGHRWEKWRTMAVPPPPKDKQEKHHPQEYEQDMHQGQQGDEDEHVGEDTLIEPPLKRQRTTLASQDQEHYPQRQPTVEKHRGTTITPTRLHAILRLQQVRTPEN